jgi:AraC-like DNA-binding protein
MREKYEAIQRMQDFIERRLESPISLAELAEEAGYSPCHASRVFKEVVGISPLDYVRARRLSRAAQRLRNPGATILEISLETSFDSHEGFTRAFKKRFGVTPEAYRRDLPAIPLFFPRSAKAYYLHYLKGASSRMEKTTTIFVQVMEKPARKLILKRGTKAAHYFEYCEEVGCDVWGILSSIGEAIHEPLGMWLPERMRPQGTSEYAQGVEVGLSYSRPAPEGMEIIELPPCRMMVFQTPPYKDEEMGQVIQHLQEAVETYQPSVFGYEWADEDAPRYQLIPLPERGYIEARPVRKRSA